MTARTRSTPRWCSRAAPAGASALTRDLDDVPRHPALLEQHDDDGAASADDQPRRPRHARPCSTLSTSVDDDADLLHRLYDQGLRACPFAGHKDNHAGLMTPSRWRASRRGMASPTAQEWEQFAGLDLPAGRARSLPRRQCLRQRRRRRRTQRRQLPCPRAARRRATRCRRRRASAASCRSRAERQRACRAAS